MFVCNRQGVADSCGMPRSLCAAVVGRQHHSSRAYSKQRHASIQHQVGAAAAGPYYVLDGSMPLQENMQDRLL